MVSISSTSPGPSQTSLTTFTQRSKDFQDDVSAFSICCSSQLQHQHVCYARLRQRLPGGVCKEEERSREPPLWAGKGHTAGGTAEAPLSKQKPPLWEYESTFCFLQKTLKMNGGTFLNLGQI